MAALAHAFERSRRPIGFFERRKNVLMDFPIVGISMNVRMILRFLTALPFASEHPQCGGSAFTLSLSGSVLSHAPRLVRRALS